MVEITTFTEDRANFYPLSLVYDPNLTQDPGYRMIIPKVNSLVMDSDGNCYQVVAVDPVTYKSTLEPASIIVTDADAGNQVSIVDYNNSIFRIYTDARNTPTRLEPSSRLIIAGDVAHYKLILNAGTSQEEVVSRYYDTDGQFTSNMVPMMPILTNEGVPSGKYYATSCHTQKLLPDDTRLTMEIYNDHGALVATVTTFTRASAILNETAGYRPQIMQIKLIGTQMRSNGELFLFENQDPDSLNLQPVLVYDDGQEVPVDVDGEKCIIYGLEDFRASWQGLKQQIIVKYWLHSDELTAPGVTDKTFVVGTADLIVVPNEVGAGVKISVVPMWSTGLNAYTLRYFMYTTDRGGVKDITVNVTIDEGVFAGTLYGSYQVLTIMTDLSVVDPTNYSDSVFHRQTVAIRLQPQAAYERYVIRDTLQSPLVYGVESPTSRRPIIHYDTDLEQYFIPSNIFLTKEGMINSFFTQAGAPYDAENEEGPPAPTHFVIRDVNTGAMVVSAPISVDDYATAWSVTGTPKGRFSGQMVLVEFIHEIDVNTQLVLYGVPVDVVESQTGYIE